MSRFLETICIRDGHPQHLEWHQHRLNATLDHFYASFDPADQHFQLIELVHRHVVQTTGIFRCRVIYDIDHLHIEILPYSPRVVTSLKLVALPSGFDYSYKYANRAVIEALYSHRGDADDILMTRHGYVTDTSIANLALRKGSRWYTPSRPLLAGTTWKRLVSAGDLIPRPIHVEDLDQFEKLRIFNAMGDIEGDVEIIGG